MPTRYTLEEDGSYRFTFMNMGTDSGTIPEDAFHHALLVDENGAPLYATQSDDDRTPEDGILAIAGMGSVAVDIQYAGCAFGAHLFVEFIP